MSHTGSSELDLGVVIREEVHFSVHELPRGPTAPRPGLPTHSSVPFPHSCIRLTRHSLVVDPGGCSSDSSLGTGLSSGQHVRDFASFGLSDHTDSRLHRHLEHFRLLLQHLVLQHLVLLGGVLPAPGVHCLVRLRVPALLASYWVSRMLRHSRQQKRHQQLRPPVGHSRARHSRAGRHSQFPVCHSRPGAGE